MEMSKKLNAKIYNQSFMVFHTIKNHNIELVSSVD